MIGYKILIKYWKLRELQGLSLVEAVNKILEMEDKND
nr:MAG TPA: hypothetical protein [Caudoviricetes sp.]